MFSPLRFGTSPFLATPVKFGLIPDEVKIKEGTIYRHATAKTTNGGDKFIKIVGQDEDIPIFFDIIHCNASGVPGYFDPDTGDFVNEEPDEFGRHASMNVRNIRSQYEVIEDS